MKKRILVISLAVTLICLLMFSLASAQISYDTSINNTREYLTVYANAFDGDKYSMDNDGAKAFSEQLDGARVTIMDAAGKVLGESLSEDIAEDHSDRPEVVGAMSAGSGFAVRRSDTLGEKLTYYCVRITYGGDYYLLRISVPTTSEWATFAESLPTLLGFMAIDVVLCLMFTYVATYFILRPVEKLTREATLNSEITTGYKELEPLVALLNERNKSLAWQMNALKEEKEHTVRAQKSKDELVSNITHEMNTPLTSIKGYAELLESGALDEKQRATAYRTIYSQSERLTNLIACIINYSEIDNEDLPPYDVDFSSIVRETVSIVLPEAEKAGVKIIENIKDGVTVSARHERLSEVAGNLIRNAIRYNKRGGTVTVTLTDDCFKVSDTGIGIAEENIDKVFSRFFTVDKSHSGKNGGFGLGLAVVKRICNRAGWDITVDSVFGEGSTFTVDFNKKS